MKRALLLTLAAVSLVAGCGGGGSPSAPTAVGPTAAPTPAPTPMLAAFGPGQYLVNSRIAPGRYFADPTRTGCYWERLSGLLP